MAIFLHGARLNIYLVNTCFFFSWYVTFFLSPKGQSRVCGTEIIVIENQRIILPNVGGKMKYLQTIDFFLIMKPCF